VIAHAVDTPPAIVQGHPGRPFRDFYFGVKLHKDGTFWRWYPIPCYGKCHEVAQRGSAIVTIVSSSGTVVVGPKKTP
jgi:hypothetical protein